ncbi:flagella synthesis protein FlgN [Shewanella holmiensis]|jgi:flagella synthesis protein FlgN|uniref:Flagellar protein FlgN n=1 Tax=Shewanella holmiensis TaxID=2952222 RepID=A0A9X3AMX5_9GAMM|nr:flagellar protein FlgN [Shewanella holmiensis]MCT7941657.1 flagellar protein FlgN [Shewanella holmiensis]
MTALSTLLSHQHGILTSLKSLISAEKQALQAQDADKLLKLAQEKQQCLIALKTNDESLANHPEHSLLTTDPELVEKVSAAKAILAVCKDINQQNASLIELNIATLNRFSQALQASRNSSSLTYNDKGKTSTISTLGNDFKA